ncbi:MAG: M81 family metallopeptidase [Betaproteobacteria bacterium]|nr:M81 family metallopeptidase [Betaproteobacteria bacterium]
MKIFFGGIATETNTFSPIPTGIEAYASCFLARAGEHGEGPNLFTAPLWALKERKREGNRDWQIVQGLCAFAMPGARTTRAAYESMRDEMLADLKASLPVDLVILGIHGAMIAEGYDDCEGDMLKRVRAMVGPDVVIGAELDLHCIFTETMVRESNLLVAFKEYPHTDIMERAFELVDLCVAAAAKRIRPVTAVFDCRMIDQMHTTREPMKSIVAQAKAMEKRPGVLSVSIGHGFPWGDVPENGAKVWVVTDNDRPLAERLAAEIGQQVIAARGQTTADHPPLEQALAEALAVTGGPVVIADTADNPGAGAAGDATFLLHALIARGIGNAVLGPLWDPVATEFCFAAGVGATLQLRIGGKVGPDSGPPLDATVTVEGLQRNASMMFGGLPTSMGDAAHVSIAVAGQAGGPIGIVLNTLRTQAYGTEVFTQFCIDLAAKRLIIVKSMQHFHAAFAPLAKKVIYMGSPGTASRDFKSLTYRNMPRPLWPFDE